MVVQPTTAVDRLSDDWMSAVSVIVILMESGALVLIFHLNNQLLVENETTKQKWRDVHTTVPEPAFFFVFVGWT